MQSMMMKITVFKMKNLKLINLLEIHEKVYISAEREISNKFENIG